MKYVIKVYVIGKTPEIDISAEEFEKIRSSKGALASAFSIERKYEILVRNYLSFEKTILSSAADKTVRSFTDYADFFESSLPFDVAMINLLTSAKLYLDQVPSDARDCVCGDSAFIESIRKKCSEEYDGHFEYRFMDAFRNYVQHSGLPVDRVSFASGWTSRESDGRPSGHLQYAVDLMISKATLVAGGDFKKKILNEMPDSVDLVAAIRRYIESLSSVQAFIRKSIDTVIVDARSMIESAHKRYAEVYSDSLVGLNIVRLNGDVAEEAIAIPIKWDDIRISLGKRNRELKNLTRRYVDGRTKDERGRD